MTSILEKNIKIGSKKKGTRRYNIMWFLSNRNGKITKRKCKFNSNFSTI